MIVVGDDHLPIDPIYRFLAYLDDVERSPNTIRSYAHHLKLFWDYLGCAKLAWTEVDSRCQESRLARLRFC